jgi:hypothetical protein
MNTNDFHIGQLVDAADTAAMNRTCATYTCKTTYGFIVSIDTRHITVAWIDSWIRGAADTSRGTSSHGIPQSCLRIA